MTDKEKYATQKKYLSNQKQLRVWVNKDKYEVFKEIVSSNGESIYSIINNFIDEYIQKHRKK